jgi:hypothetical protein
LTNRPSVIFTFALSTELHPKIRLGYAFCAFTSYFWPYIACGE